MGISKVRYEDIIEHPEVYGEVLPKWANELFAKGFEGVSAIDFYEDIFEDDLAEERESPEEYQTGEYSAIAVERVPRFDVNGNPILDKNGKETYKGVRVQVTRDKQALYDLIDRSDNFCLMSPISYAGRRRTNENARFMYAFCIEVDGIEPKNGIDELVYSWERDYKPIPKPTYIVCSGNGLHLYYVFTRPVPLWRNVFESIAEYKKHITPWIWSKYITNEYEKIQWESINQPFRIVGTRTKSGGYALAFRVGKKVTVEYMNTFVPADKAMTAVYKSTYTLKEAKRLYPNWYKRRIEAGEGRGHWNRHKGIYYNWIEKILSSAVVGTRYKCLENLCSLAVQCNIPPEEIESDCRRIAERFERLTVNDDNHFTEHDILCALKTYHEGKEQAYRRRIEYISKKTKIPLTANKRNYRTQAEHIKVMTAIRDIVKPDWRNKDGRPKGSGTKAEAIQVWRVAHPQGRKIDCHRDTGFSRMTIDKWWDYVPTVPDESSGNGSVKEQLRHNLENLKIEIKDKKYSLFISVLLDMVKSSSDELSEAAAKLMEQTYLELLFEREEVMSAVLGGNISLKKRYEVFWQSYLSEIGRN